MGEGETEGVREMGKGEAEGTTGVGRATKTTVGADHDASQFPSH